MLGAVVVSGDGALALGTAGAGVGAAFGASDVSGCATATVGTTAGVDAVGAALT